MVSGTDRNVDYEDIDFATTTTGSSGMESTADETAARNVSSYFATSVADETAARDVTSYFVTSVAEHVVAVITISLACFIGNGVVIHVYRSKRGNSFGKLYIILLAIIDIFACCTLLPIYPLLRLEVVSTQIYR